MRLLALIALLFGAGALAYAGFELTSGDREGEGENRSAARLPVLLAFAASMAVGGGLLWVVGARANTEAMGSSVRPQTSTPEDRVARANPDRLP